MKVGPALSVNPANGKVIAAYDFQSAAELDASLQRAYGGFEAWSAAPLPARVAVIRRVGAILRSRLEPLARLATLEMGKPIRQARAEVEKCAVLCDWYAEQGSGILADQVTAIGSDAYLSFHPLGPVLAVMPWNFPFWQVMRGAVPILLGGNAYVLKPAPNVIGCAHALADVWDEAGLHDGALTVINVSNELTSIAICDRRIAAVTVTGSARAGSAIAAQAGAALKKSVLELGGSDPFIVLDAADVPRAVEAAIASRYQNAGQVCIAAKRIIVDARIADRFEALFVERAAALKVGDPFAETTEIGPMARSDLRDELHEQVKETVKQGARLLLGGQPLSGAGNFYAPTVLSQVRPGMRAFVEETFGPAAVLVVAENTGHALELANDSDYGLSAAIWSGDERLAQAMARRLAVGGVFINGYSASDPRIPIGGVKKSGFGRELSHFGVHEFMNIQAAWIGRPPPAKEWLSPR